VTITNRLRSTDRQLKWRYAKQPGLPSKAFLKRLTSAHEIYLLISGDLANSFPRNFSVIKVAVKHTIIRFFPEVSGRQTGAVFR